MFTASIIVPCYNEENTLRESVTRVLEIADDNLSLEVIIVDDCSNDGSLDVARRLSHEHNQVRLVCHEQNKGKGAALRTGIKEAKGDAVAIHDADLEYDPHDLRQLLELIRMDKADVVFGSRFITGGAHRVLYFWHSMGNRFLTFLSNMLTDLNLTDMETCYKVFRRGIIQSIQIQENRFGFEPEIVAKVARKGVRIYEMGISYAGRTYEEGKKIGVKDGIRALYCILRYNGWRCSGPLQFFLYTPLLVLGAILNVLIFSILELFSSSMTASLSVAYLISTIGIAFMAVNLLFRKGSRWSGMIENTLHGFSLIVGLMFDLGLVFMLSSFLKYLVVSKFIAVLITYTFLFLAYRRMIFSSRCRGDIKED